MTEAAVKTDTQAPNFAETFLSFLMGGASKPAAAAATGDTAAVSKADFDKLTGDVARLTEAMTKIAKRITGDAEKDEWGEDPDDKSDEAEGRRKKAKAKKDDDGAKTGDVGVQLATLLSRAEILAPGTKFQTFDAAAATGAAVADHICACQRQVLTSAWAQPKTRESVKPFVTSDAPDFANLDPRAIEIAFMGASEVVRQLNNAAVALASAGAPRQATGDDGRYRAGSTAAMAEDFNRAAAEGWAARGGLTKN